MTDFKGLSERAYNCRKLSLYYFTVAFSQNNGLFASCVETCLVREGGSKVSFEGGLEGAGKKVDDARTGDGVWYRN